MTSGDNRDDNLSLGVDALISQARSSEDGEAYLLIARRGHYWIGLVVTAAPSRPPAFRIEVLLRLIGQDALLGIADLERTKATVDKLADAGYTMGHLDNGWLIFVRDLIDDDLDRECLAISEVMRLMQDQGTTVQ